MGGNEAEDFDDFICQVEIVVPGQEEVNKDVCGYERVRRPGGFSDFEIGSDREHVGVGREFWVFGERFSISYVNCCPMCRAGKGPLFWLSGGLLQVKG